MRFVVKREELLKALLVVGRAVNSKSSAVPVLANLKLELNDRGLFITGSNYELTIQTQIPYSRNDVELIRNCEQGATLINAKILTDMARKIESQELSLEVIDSTIALISGGNIKYDLNCIRAEEYPDVDLLADGTKLKLTRTEFSSLVNQTAFAASLKEQRPVLTAMHLETEEGVFHKRHHPVVFRCAYPCPHSHRRNMVPPSRDGDPGREDGCCGVCAPMCCSGSCPQPP